mmetsp:Transcript_10450/g.45402  ORF Transcript_10450/g.45402 Transcript_10450/m.45402 type:complete len:200 (-) Transcript_10450:483-1082(-)
MAPRSTGTTKVRPVGATRSNSGDDAATLAKASPFSGVIRALLRPSANFAGTVRLGVSQNATVLVPLLPAPPPSAPSSAPPSAPARAPRRDSPAPNILPAEFGDASSAAKFASAAPYSPASSTCSSCHSAAPMTSAAGGRLPSSSNRSLTRDVTFCAKGAHANFATAPLAASGCVQSLCFCDVSRRQASGSLATKRSIAA